MTKFKIGDEVWCCFASVRCAGTEDGVCTLKFKGKIIDLPEDATVEQKKQVESGEFMAIQLIFSLSVPSPLMLKSDDVNRCYSCPNGIVRWLLDMDIAIHPVQLISH